MQDATAFKFKVGDRVLYTDDQGIIFERCEITGFYETTKYLYRYGYRYCINHKDRYKTPVKEESLSLDTSLALQHSENEREKEGASSDWLDEYYGKYDPQTDTWYPR